MIALTIGLSLSICSIGVLFYFNNQLKRKLESNNKALLALQKEFTQYQLNEKRTYEKETAKREIRFDNVARSIKKNEDAIYGVNKRMPEEVKKAIKHIEFARPLDKK